MYGGQGGVCDYVWLHVTSHDQQHVRMCRATQALVPMMHAPVLGIDAGVQHDESSQPLAESAQAVDESVKLLEEEQQRQQRMRPFAAVQVILPFCFGFF